ncbi:hypothetical protein FA13DRAFT_1799168 [Coprinellus micaceus]|uniref:Uncharacterized protein n=1 Tax=Coprinellus micaceus TaxID=71717 RepID=A0A4Y7SKK7_COPMI|nr:hypothetical protein FA13DRAFT_1799168 [Coprinellus micaceus]
MDQDWRFVELKEVKQLKRSSSAPPDLYRNVLVTQRRRLGDSSSNPSASSQGPTRAERQILNDILRVIFDYVLYDEQLEESNIFTEGRWINEPEGMLQLSVLAQVGEQWGRVAYSTGTFASKVLDPRAVPLTFERFLRLSRTAGLVVDLEDYLKGLEGFPGQNYYTLLNDLQRVKGLNFIIGTAVGTSRTLPPLLRALCLPAPQLEVLVIRAKMDEDDFRITIRPPHPYTVRNTDPLLGNCPSTLRHLILKDILIIPSLTNPAFCNLVTLKMETTLGYLTVDIVLRWLELGQTLKGLETLSFKGVTRSDTITIHSKMKRFPHPRPGCASQDLMQECAQECAQPWQSDSGLVRCQTSELVLDEAENQKNLLGTYLGVSYTTSQRRVDVRFADAPGDYAPLVTRPFADFLVVGSAPKIDDETELKIRVAIPTQYNEPRRNDPYPDILRTLLSRWRDSGEAEKIP